MKHPDPTTAIKRAWGQCLVRLFVSAVTAFAWLPDGANAACDTNWVLLHSQLAGRHWGQAKQQTVVSLPESLCTLVVADVGLTGSGDKNAAVLFGAAGDVHAAEISYADAFCGPMITVKAPLRLSLPYLPAQPHAVLRGARTDSVALALASLSGRVSLYLLSTTTGAATLIDTLALVMGPGQGVTSLWGDPGVPGTSDTAIWVLGPGGVARRVPAEAGGLGSPVTFDLAETVTPTAAGSGLVGSAAGRIYRPTGSALVDDGAVGTEAIRTVAATGGAGDNGSIFYRSADGSSWQYSSVGAATYRHVNFVQTAAGSAVELLDSAWGYRSRTYRDTPTRFGSLLPAELNAFVNGEAFPGGGNGLLTASVALADPDGNHQLPVLRLLKEGQSADLIAWTDGADTLRARSPEGSCSIGTHRLDSTVVSLGLLGTTITGEANAKVGVFNFSCGTCYWARETFTFTLDWAKGDTLVIASGPDTLRMYCPDPGAVTSSSLVPSVGRQFGTVAVTVRGRNLGLSPEGVPAESIRDLRLLDARGREVANLEPSRGRTAAVLARPLAQGILYLQYTLVDGTRGLRTFSYLP